MPAKKDKLDYSRFDKLDDYEADSDEEDWKLSEAALKAKRDAKKDAMIKKELAGYEEIEEKLKRAEKLPALKAKEGEYSAAAEVAPWSAGRAQDARDVADAARRKGDRQRECFRAAEAVLSQFADDATFQADLKRPCVDRAIRHWTNESRLPKDEAQALFAEDSFDYSQYLRPALAKLTRLQAACTGAGIGVPIESVFKGRRTVFEPRPEPEPELTEAEKTAKARKDWEDAVFKDMPPAEPFSWRKLGKQLALQLVVMGVCMLYFKFYVAPGLQDDLASLQAGEAAAQEPSDGALDEF
ncbi:hypothetical protein M885DRAFT_520352 [Pelagophyceae sp. CCMP2097]|nr:hypothetical protein M885DRAFT_520352 [Pelagophyceae sp. CCMP2097]